MALSKAYIAEMKRAFRDEKRADKVCTEIVVDLLHDAIYGEKAEPRKSLLERLKDEH